ncbi:HlyD family efflux transporter periplasmic adaptor subunit [Pseudomonas guariconensis]|uniref:efflux RND transporter periplasmic adaptor subunit n=1 Tax=Pseudomonas TaxID=286 RepID=UPI00209771B7|nr:MULTISPECIES: HlyD family efflux transporter periplasmic adaptor subunit [Pseudomonas]MCO7639378.1 HlyD family efflux transporter periplasmic adaptor subunit [Pseudomonas sp. S 311-6]MCO7515156.1 HlyD family efflux transporter periplasmic adaptor subunit [Pseudomonas putida]MCO7565082.1 HlyD family efflux transporter periplasmic adaptor subunit [Pseudomonas mosselii]MCO7605033.1 HlyD family efflux transporter periplasmic adaptor subunit [Pseudomonas guariconensis]MCO7616319.1 HlyD family ef
MSEILPPPQLLLSLASLRDRALAAESVNALAFSMANDLYALLRFRQALVLAQHGGHLELLCISGLARPTEDSPYLVWLRRASHWLNQRLSEPTPTWLPREGLALPEDIADGWAEWWPSGLWCIPLQDRHGQRLGLLLFLLDEAPAPSLVNLLQGVFQTWAHCWAAFGKPRPLRFWRPSRRQALVGLGVLAALLLVPVRQTALAPAEVVSRNAQVISSPIDGVIARMLVRPNQPVEVGTPLFALDETTLRSRAEVLAKEVAVADAELLAANQRAFDNPQSKGELAVLTGTLRQRRAELAAVQAQLARTTVLSPRAGVAVYSDPNDWLGKPVVIGERILQVADPRQPGLRIHLPVADAIALDSGAPVTLFLTAYPLSPLHGAILETSYEARPGDDGVASYRLLASVEGTPAHARLGLHGTAKLYGERVPLGYYLLRRPLAAARAWTGW